MEHIDAPNMQLFAFAATQFDDGQANRVRTSRRSGRKHTMRPIVRGWCAEQFEPLGAIELPNHDEMREALDVGEPRLKLGQDLEHTIASCLAPRPLGISLASLYGLLTNPIGCEVNIRLRFPSSWLKTSALLPSLSWLQGENASVPATAGRCLPRESRRRGTPKQWFQSHHCRGSPTR
jgi:hypothetical protein